MPKATPKSTKSNSRRSRSFGGCGTCRRRHVKCDQVRPECLTCKAVGATCEGFSAHIKWMSSKNDDGSHREVSPIASGVSRRHLYTESDREKMSSSLVAALPIGSVDASLAELDTRAKGASAVSETMGPFSVINFNGPAEVEGSTDVAVPEHIAGESHAPPGAPQEIVTPLTVDFWIGLDDTLQWADLFGLGTDALFQPLENLYDPLLDLHGNMSTFAPEQDDVYNQVLTQDNHDMFAGAGPEDLPSDSHQSSVDEILSEAQVLLKHFRRSVISRFASLPITTTSPWESIMFIEAVTTLAHLTYLGTVKVTGAKRANLFSVLSISAYHLAKNPSDDENLVRRPGEWDRLASASMHEARQNVQQSIKYELQGPSKAKYKDQLMATLGLLALAVIIGEQKEARCYLVDAERLMRHRGLAKREMSRKARLLHHMYTWSRIIGESTYVLHEYGNTLAAACSQFVVQARPADASQQSVLPPSGPGSRLDDFLRLESHHTDNDLEIQDTKEPQTSLRDIHLEDSRDNPNTMYHQIYGISETWLTLLSQTTRLANHMDGIKAANSDNSALSDLLQRRATRLEDMICSFTENFAPVWTTPKWAPNNHMHRALNSALVIFFYRRIRKVNSLILQSYVDDVIAALADFDQSLSEKIWEGPGSPWAAFMAGCEASTPARRDTLLKWIEKGSTMTGFLCYESAKDLLLQVWARKGNVQQENTPAGSTGPARRKGSHAATSWVDVCREQKVWFMAF